MPARDESDRSAPEPVVSRRAPSPGVDPLSAPVQRRLAAILLPALALLALAIATVHARERSEDRERAQQAAFEVVRLQSHTTVRVIEMVSSIALYLAEETTLRGFLAGDSDADALRANFEQFQRSAKMFDRVRLLDRDGAFLAGQGTGSDPELAWLIDALEPGQVYVSPFGLAPGAEGSAAPRPVLHFAALAGTNDGAEALLVLDYYGDSILRLVEQTGLRLPGWTAIVDGEGHYLEAPTPAGGPGASWTALAGGAPGFATAHPAAWAAFGGDRVGNHLDLLGLYVFSRVPTPKHRATALSELEISTVCHVPTSELYARSRRTLRILLAGGALAAALFAAAAWRLAFAGAVRAEHERRLTESQRGLRKLSARLVEVQEEERRRISRDLHDELGQQATAIAIGLKRAAKSEDPAATGELVQQAIAATDELLGGVHRISTRLRSSLLDDLGLAAALRATCDDVRERAELPVIARIDLESDDPPIPPEVAQTVFRFVQEGLTNAVKHARAGEVCVEVRIEAHGAESRPAAESRLVAEVRDDGVGFDPATPTDNRLGLLGMRERIELSRGEFRCESEPGKGTRLWTAFELGGRT